LDSDFREVRYRLAPGSQVREEDFGLLFYTQQGPGLFFVSSGKLLGEAFIQRQETLWAWSRRWEDAGAATEARWTAVQRILDALHAKGVIHAC
jgi:putative mycofactocin binding protein MftB